MICFGVFLMCMMCLVLLFTARASDETTGFPSSWLHAYVKSSNQFGKYFVKRKRLHTCLYLSFHFSVNSKWFAPGSHINTWSVVWVRAVRAMTVFGGIDLLHEVLTLSLCMIKISRSKSLCLSLPLMLQQFAKLVRHSR